MAPGQRVIDGLGLMRVELIDAARLERSYQPWVERFGNGVSWAATAGNRRTAVT
jgi:hypothetical protein